MTPKYDASHTHHPACDPGWGPANYRCHPACPVAHPVPEARERESELLKGEAFQPGVAYGPRQDGIFGEPTDDNPLKWMPLEREPEPYLHPYDLCSCGHEREGHHRLGRCHGVRCKCTGFVLGKRNTAPDLAALRGLVERWKAEGARCDTFHATMGTGWKACAAELEKLLPPDPTGEK